MDNTELHYLTYFPDEIWHRMMENYVEAGGDILYPGDEKEMLLRSVQADIIQVFAGVDNAIRQSTLRYAVGDYLDIIGEQRGCERISASAATATVEITTNADAEPGIIESGAAMTCDGEIFYVLTEDVVLSGGTETLTAFIAADREGVIGNGLRAGAQMELVIRHDAVDRIAVTIGASGGNDREEDEEYRERIRQHTLSAVTTGTKAQYEEAAMSVSSAITDAKAINSGRGQVSVIVLIPNTTVRAAVIQEVAALLTSDEVRPLTDSVSVSHAIDIPYTLNVEYTTDTGINISEAVRDAVSSYQEWQDKAIGRPFNPDRLMAMLYQAGCTRVLWGDGSEFGDDHGEIGYTEIGESYRCCGEITLTDVTV